MVSPKIIAIALVAGGCFAFGGGWKVNGWRLHSQMVKQTQDWQAAIDKAKADAQAFVDSVNAGSQERENNLLAQIDTEKQKTEELQHEIDTRPTIKQIVRVPVKTDSGVECPAVPSVDWSVFQPVYNCAADHDSKTCLASGGIPAVPSGLTETVGGSSDNVGSGP